MTVKELINKLNNCVVDDRTLLDAKVIFRVENDDSIKMTDIDYVVINDDDVISLEGK